MNLLQRTMIHIKRQKGQTLALTGIIFLMSTFIVATILVNQGIERTDKALRAQLPAVAILRQDIEAFNEEWIETGIWPELGAVTTSLLGELGALEYVREFNYTVLGHEFYSEALTRVWYPELFMEAVEPISDPVDDMSLAKWNVTFLERFALNGVGNPNVWEMEAGIITLVGGRTFYETELEGGVPVAIVSQSFLNRNNLILGDYFSLYNILQDYPIPDTERYQEQHIIFQRAYEFQVIGVFEHELMGNRPLYGQDFKEHIQILNQIFVPATFIESTISPQLEALDSDEALARFQGLENIIDGLDFRNMYFLLYDPMDLLLFREAASKITPDFWMISDYSFIYGDFAESMEMMRELADYLLIGVISVMLITLALLTLLLLRMRRVEFGIFLSLGEKKHKIVCQVLFEIVFSALIGIAIALLVGNALSYDVSSTMMRNHLMDIVADSNRVIDLYEVVGIRHEITHEEMLELYNIRIDMQTILYLYALIIGTIAVSVIIPIYVTLKRKPRDILS